MKKAEHLIERIADMKNLEQAADDALDALDDKNVWYAQKFRKGRDRYLKAIQKMILTETYPQKDYKPVTLKTEIKERDIYPLHFYPWSIIFHAIKIVLEPVIERQYIYDSSAGIIGRGQLFGALRIKMFYRRFKWMKWYCQSDIRKFYPSIPHKVIIDTLREYVDDEPFIRMIELTMLDYRSDIQDILDEEIERKYKYCNWVAPRETIAEYDERGITIGSCISQLIGNMVMTSLDKAIKEDRHEKAYHRHCDDQFNGKRNESECIEYMRWLDGECNKMGLVLKASSYYAPVCDEKKDVPGRRLDSIGYVYSRHNMRLRKRTKQRMARALKRVKSKRRRKEILAAYWGWCKYGRCKNLWNKLTDKMSFAAVGIKTEIVGTDENGKRMFNVPREDAKHLVDKPIVIYDFEDGLVIKGKDGRCSILYREEHEPEETRKKFILSSKRVIDKLNRARKIEAEEGKHIFPQPTRLIRVPIDGGLSTYDLE